MSSALKPAQSPVAGPQASGQPSPTKSFQTPQNSHSLLVGQNLSHNSNQNSQQNAAHAVPMAPVSQNMAQMAQNMSHHGNLSLANQNSTVQPAITGKSTVNTPLSLVQEKVTPSQPLALTRTPEKKDDVLQSNGTSESPKSAKTPDQIESKMSPKLKQDAPKTSTKPEDNISPAKVDVPKVAVSEGSEIKKAELPVKPVEKNEAKVAEKVETKIVEKNELKAAEKNEAKIIEKIESKIVEKNEPKILEKKEVKPVDSIKAQEQPKVEVTPPKEALTPPKEEDKKPEEGKVAIAEAAIAPVSMATKEEDKIKNQETGKESEHKLAESAETPKAPTPSKEGKQATPKPAAKAPATPTPRKRKQESKSPAKAQDGPTPAKKPAEGEAATPASARAKRNRIQVQPYQSPTPELAMATKLSASHDRSTPTKTGDDKLIVFYKNEYLAVRNAEGGFYICQTMQNVYRSTRKIKIRWLSQDKSTDPSGETYKPDFYDTTDMECVLTTLSLKRGNGGTQILRGSEAARAASILQRALMAESGDAPQLSETHPDGLDLSLYKDESQLEVRKSTTPRKRSISKSDKNTSSAGEEAPTPAKRRKKAAKKSKKVKKTIMDDGKKDKASSKGKSAAPVQSAKSAKSSAPAKKSSSRTAKTEAAPIVAKKEKFMPKRNEKAKVIQPTPSTSTGKSTRTQRKPPAKK